MPMTDSALSSMSAVELRELLGAGRVSAREVCEAALARVEAVNPEINAIVALRAEEALADADAADALPAVERGLLHGLPFAVKDLHEAAGLPFTRGSLAWAEAVADSDEPWLEQVRAAGAILIGKTNTPELGTKPTTWNRVHGPTRNPRATDRTTGGSSGGAGAAVAANMVPFAPGSDAGGSCRQPASCCAVVGVKTSRGRVRLPGAGADFENIDTVGPLARTVADAALFLDACADPAYRHGGAGSFLDAAAREPARLRLAYTSRVLEGELSAEVQRVFEQALARLEGIGHELVEVAPALSDLRDPWLTTVFVSMGQLAAELSASEMAQIEPANLRMMIHGSKVSAVDYVQALGRAREATARVLDDLVPYDALLTPTLTVPPYQLEELTPESDEDEVWRHYFAWGEFLYPFNVTGQPAISVPAGASDSGLPIGLQIVGPPGGEAALLSLAAAFERAS